MNRSVVVNRGGRLRAAGLRFGEIVAYDWGFEYQGRARVQRTFVLLDEGFQIDQPVVFPPEQQGWWYCDLITVTDDGETIRTDDLYIDVIVGPPDQPYRLLDLHEYADAIASGLLDTATAADGLRRAQSFLDRRLNRRHDVDRTWPAFPPSAVEELLDVALPQDWTLL